MGTAYLHHGLGAKVQRSVFCPERRVRKVRTWDRGSGGSVHRLGWCGAGLQGGHVFDDFGMCQFWNALTQQVHGEDPSLGRRGLADLVVQVVHGGPGDHLPEAARGLQQPATRP